MLVTDGVYLSSARDAPALCAAPTLIYNPPGTTHRDCFRSESGRFFTISVAASALGHAASCTNLPDSAFVLPPHLVTLARRVGRECLSPDGASSLVAEALCLELLARTSRSFDRERPRSPGWLRRARELLHDACGEEEMSIAGIAAAVGVHPVHLTRTFRHHFRCTPGEYLRRCRLEKAAALLAGSAAPLAEVRARERLRGPEPSLEGVQAGLRRDPLGVPASPLISRFVAYKTPRAAGRTVRP